MNKVTKNIIANYLGKLWGFVSIFIFVRFYIDLLGIESYAIINFYAVILGLLVFADGGLTATLTRELARDSSIFEKSNLVYTLERIYIGICIAIIIVILFSADIISQNFLNSKHYPPSEIAYYIRLMGVGVAFQLFSTLYDGGLQGLQYQVLTNKIKVIWSIFRSGVILLPLYLYPRLDIYFWWQIVCNIILILVLRNKLYSLLIKERLFFSIQLLKDNYKYALGMMGIAFISAINIQIDKIVTSKYLSVELFGYYSIASLFSQIPIMIAIPITIAVFPLFSSFISQKNTEATIINFHKYSFLITVIVAPIVFCIALYSVPLVTLWTGNADIAHSVDYVVKMLVIGGFFLCLQLTPFYLALANGFTKINLYIGIGGLVIIIPLMIYSIKHYGMLGATFPWVFINLTGFIIMGLYVTNRFLAGNTIKWMFFDVFSPTLITVIVGVAVNWMAIFVKYPYVFIVESIIIGIVSILINLIIYNTCNPSNKLFDFFIKLNFIRKDSK